MISSLIACHAGYFDLAVTPGAGMVTTVAQWVSSFLKFVASHFAGQI